MASYKKFKMNDRYTSKPNYDSKKLYFIIDPLPNVEELRKQYTQFNNCLLNFLHKYYDKFLDIFGRIYIKCDNKYFNLLNSKHLNSLSKIGIIYKKSYNYRIFILDGKPVSGG
jgi:hypothetical protein